MPKPIHFLYLFSMLALVTAIEFTFREPVHAVPPVREMGVTHVNTGFTLSVSTSAWTALTATPFAGRSSIHCSNPASNTAAVAFILSHESTTPTEATTVRPYEMGKGENALIQATEGVYVYFISLHTSAESIHCQEISNR